VSRPITETDIAGGWGGMAVEMLLHNIMLGQSVQGNTMANVWLLTGAQKANVSITDAMVRLFWPRMDIAIVKLIIK
jgi:hypothetical protein